MSASQQPSHFQIFGIRHNRNERLQHRVRRNEVLSSLGAAGLALMACLLVLNLRAAGQDVQKVSSKPSVFANTTSLNGPDTSKFEHAAGPPLHARMKSAYGLFSGTRGMVAAGRL